MTEHEWLVGDDPEPMLKWARNEVSERKFRLFGCACCHRIRHLLTNSWSKKAARAAEQIAEGEEYDDGVFSMACYVSSEHRPGGRVDAAALAAVCSMDGFSALNPPRNLYQDRILFTAEATSFHSAVAIARPAVYDPNRDAAKFKAERSIQANILRDIVGNPFRHFIVDSNWLTWNGNTIPNMAQMIYAERSFERMPILADAFEEAGCDRPDVLAHCRGLGPHTKGCFVIDQILGKH